MASFGSRRRLFPSSALWKLTSQTLQTFLIIALAACVIIETASAKNLDAGSNGDVGHYHHRRRIQRDSPVHNELQCATVRGYFESIDIKLKEGFAEKENLTSAQFAVVMKELTEIKEEQMQMRKLIGRLSKEMVIILREIRKRPASKAASATKTKIIPAKPLQSAEELEAFEGVIKDNQNLEDFIEKLIALPYKNSTDFVRKCWGCLLADELAVEMTWRGTKEKAAASSLVIVCAIKGAICGGSCCSNTTEIDLRKKATTEFERLLHHHTKSLRGILESTATLFQNHVLELTEQSENKTLTVFAKVYQRMVPFSKKLIHQLYSEIMSHLKYPNGAISNNHNLLNHLKSLEEAINNFFVNLFPVAYHQAVTKSKEEAGELHDDYVNCLKHTFEDLQPFDVIPKVIARNLIQSVQTAAIFMNALQQSAEVLSETDELYALYLSNTCQKQLLKMSYCPSCNGMQRTHAKACFSYCMNVLRGCSAQYAGVLDSPWSSVVDAIENLVQAHIRSDSGIVTIIKQLDTKLSEAIMYAMENGPNLEKKVKKTCGTPKLLPIGSEPEQRPHGPPKNIKWATPPDAEILRFLSTIDKSKEFYSNIVNNVCEDDDIQRNDRGCWTGDRIGDYTQLLMTIGVDTQRYNPEVPLEVNPQASKLHLLVDKLIKIRKNIASAIPSTKRPYSDIQSDMARHDEEGSGRISDSDDIDDEEYGSIHGSGDGSGDGATAAPYNPTAPTFVTNHDVQEPKTADGVAPTATSLGALLITTLVIIFFMDSSYAAMVLAH